MQFYNIAFKGSLINRTMSFYAVAKGRKIGIYNTWAECEEKVKSYTGARYKKFPTRKEAEDFISAYYVDGMKLKYKPEGFAVLPKPEGIGTNKESGQNDDKEKEESDDIWPPCDGDECQITDEELLMAVAEVEGLPYDSESRKRKLAMNTDKSSTSKIPRHESVIWEPVGLKHVGNMEFLLDSEGYVIVYTDGSCFNNGQKNACAGYGVYFGDDHVLNVGKPVTGRVTNNVGEIQAAIYAIKTAKRLGITKLCLSTDSQFLINSVTLWIKGWKAKNWRLRNGDPVKNLNEFKELDALLQDNEINIKWNYVMAHKGIKGNEMADKLAREGSEIHRRMNATHM